MFEKDSKPKNPPIRWPPYRPVQPSSNARYGFVEVGPWTRLLAAAPERRWASTRNRMGWDVPWDGDCMVSLCQKKKNCCWLCFVSIFIAQNQGIQHDSTSHSNLGMLWRLSWGIYGDVFYASNVAGQKCPMEFDAFPKTSIQCGASA